MTHPVPIGFSFAGVAAGIKPQRPDLALVYSAAPCAAAAVTTVNKAKAAPVLDVEARLPSGDVHAVVVNSGNANALTGASGGEAVRAVQAAVAAALGVAPTAVLSASTGVIGVKLPVEKITLAAPSLVAGLAPDVEAAARAIMTTDTREKIASRTVTLAGRAVTLTAIAKGSGMIAPELATMIAVVTTDCSIAPPMLARALQGAAATSFNRLTVDGDMSTNDVVFALANGQAKNREIAGAGAAFDAFSGALSSLCEELARAIAADGEGATKRLEIAISGAPALAVAEDIARAIAASPLVKTAVFGADPNWGRVLATVGARSGSRKFDVNPYRAAVSIQRTLVYDGAPVEHDREALRTKMREPEIAIEVDLRAGSHTATAWGCDLSYDYVKINADYSSLIVPNPDGSVAKDDRLASYSPAFKVSLLIQALGYIGRFKGQRCVIKYGGAAMTTEPLRRSFCEDILLLRSVGLRPIVVHGGGPEISRALEKFGTKPEFVDGQRVTNASDLKVVEMVLTGSINTELVTMLNRRGANAVGLSGKDGALLKAKKLLREDGKDLGQVGELVEVNGKLIEMVLDQYVPVVSPVGIGDDGESYNLNADIVAAGIAVAVGAPKLIYLSDVPGVLDKSGIVSELTFEALEQKLGDGEITGGMAVKSRSILRALAGGVRAVHVLDGRTPHSVIAELFTESGVGTIVRPSRPGAGGASREGGTTP
jgi:acetylglutamate kinase